MAKRPSKRANPKDTRKAPASSTRASVDASAPREGHPPQSTFRPGILAKSVIAIPLLNILKRDTNEPAKIHAIVIDLNLEYPKGIQGARAWTKDAIEKIVKEKGITKAPQQGLRPEKSGTNPQYLFAKLEAGVIRELAQQNAKESAIYHIWPDFQVRALVNKSISTVKADAAHASFSAFGDGIVWAVLDTGIDITHPHFTQYENLVLKKPLEHEDFTGTGLATEDPFGHGTHVAGIIAGGMTASKKREIRAFTRYLDEQGEPQDLQLTIESISGMAPKCKLLSMRVLDENGVGEVSSVLAAIAKIQEINGYGRRLLIHGVNMSIGYDFDPEWFACGHSPLCVEVDRLASTGVVVVVAAGNAGYGVAKSEYQGDVHAGLDMTIGDPGNAALAITVGSTHRTSPHTYGVSYFSSKGPTGDGRPKPDVVAPGEKIISCATGALRAESNAGECDYVENSGTSMAAPHVSGVIAAFLSVREEFKGESEKVKQVFMSSATDLKRERYFQGSGLVDLMRAVQSV
ncbi:MAG: S8 family peptidase [Acidobacteriota bacterium]